jgi:pyruvate ferredoxin oxidoreductase gamma subunit
VVLDPTLLSVVDVTEGLKKDGVIVVNTTETPAQVRERLKLKGGKVYTVNASHIAIEELGREITNTPMLGALCVATGMFSVDTVAQQIEKDFGKKMRKDVVEANVRAVRRAAAEVQVG